MERKSSFDFLRIIAMWLILTAHFLGWGGAVNSLTVHDFNFFWVMPIYFVSQIGNTLFFMLSGYFAGKPKLEKAIFLERKAAFYSTVITWIMYVGGGATLTYAIHAMFPLLFKKYWFISVYLVLYGLELILVPCLKKIEKKHFQIAILVLLLNNTLNDLGDYNLLGGILAFMIGFYIREYKPLSTVKKSKIMLMYIMVMLFYSVERVIVLKLGIEHGKWDEIARYTLLLIAATLLFCFFERLEIKWRWPTRVAPNILSVYLITANPAITNLLYVQFLKVGELSSRAYFILFYVGVNIAAICSCVSVDKIISKVNRFETNKLTRIIRKILK